MGTPKPGINLVLTLPGRIIEELNQLCQDLQTTRTNMINMLIYANPQFKSGDFRDAYVVKDPLKRDTIIRICPYAYEIAVAAAKVNRTFPGSWLKKLIITRFDQKIKENYNVLNIGKHPELPERLAKKRDKDNGRRWDKIKKRGSAPAVVAKEFSRRVLDGAL